MEHNPGVAAVGGAAMSSGPASIGHDKKSAASPSAAAAPTPGSSGGSNSSSSAAAGQPEVKVKGILKPPPPSSDLRSFPSLPESFLLRLGMNRKGGILW